MFDLFMHVMQPTSMTSILDLGVTPDRSLPESNYFEKFYPYKNKITAVSIEDASFLEEEYPGLRFVHIKPGDLPFEDDEFDIIFCSAVLEHVGTSEAQRFFVRESLRVAKQFFITTPNRFFPIEFHTFLPFVHWLPQGVHQSVLRSLGLHFWAKTENLNLVTPRVFRTLFPPCTSLHFMKYRLFGFSSNLIIFGKK